MSALQSRALISIVLEIFGEKFETRRDAQIQDHHLRRLVEIVFDRSGRRGGIVLEQALAIVGSVAGERLNCSFLIPRKEISADNLICEPALSFKTNLDGVDFPLLDGFENKLVLPVVVFWAHYRSFAGRVV